MKYKKFGFKKVNDIDDWLKFDGLTSFINKCVKMEFLGTAFYNTFYSRLILQDRPPILT